MGYAISSFLYENECRNIYKQKIFHNRNVQEIYLHVYLNLEKKITYDDMHFSNDNK